jgi:hypothetical protein
MAMRRTIRRPWWIVVALIALCCVPSTAVADIYERLLIFPAPPQPPSYAPELPIAQRYLYPRVFGIRFDSGAGILTISFGFYEPDYWAPRLIMPQEASYVAYASYITFKVTPDCKERTNAEAEGIYGAVTPDRGTVSLAGYNGSLGVKTTYSGGNYTATFADPAFVRTLTCLGGASIGTNEVQTRPLVDITPHAAPAPPAPPAPSRPKCAGHYARIGGRLTCLRNGAKCYVRYRQQYARPHYACVRRGGRYRLVRR